MGRWVKYQRGHYLDALRKHSRVVPVIIEATGGIAPPHEFRRSPLEAAFWAVESSIRDKLEVWLPRTGP